MVMARRTAADDVHEVEVEAQLAFAVEPEAGTRPVRRASGVREATLHSPDRAPDPSRRRHSRFVVDQPVAFVQRGSDIEARCTSLSLGGMFIATNRRIKVGAVLSIWLELPHGAKLFVSGSVRWTTTDGIGVQHALLGARDTFVLTEYLASLT
jgi:hypothetical protein